MFFSCRKGRFFAEQHVFLKENRIRGLVWSLLVVDLYRSPPQGQPSFTFHVFQAEGPGIFSPLVSKKNKNILFLTVS